MSTRLEKKTTGYFILGDAKSLRIKKKLCRKPLKDTEIELSARYMADKKIPKDHNCNVCHLLSLCLHFKVFKQPNIALLQLGFEKFDELPFLTETTEAHIHLAHSDVPITF